MQSSLSLSREFAAAGMEKQAADAIAEAIVTHSDESHATKADLAKVEARMGERLAKLEAKMSLIIIVVSGIFVGVIADIIVTLLKG